MSGVVRRRSIEAPAAAARRTGRVPGWAGFAAVTLAGAAAAWVMVGTGFANYDAAYSLVWGRDLARGHLPDYDVPVAPTPHPLSNLVGAILSPLGDGAETALVVIAFLALGALAALTYVLGARWFGRAAGALAAAIVITRQPVLSFGARAYLDIPYVVLVLAALATEVRRPRAGAPVLVWLTLAGLLRPEAWLFSFAYVSYLWWAGERDPRRAAVLLGLAAAAPAIWLVADAIVTGDPLWSLTDTREGAQELGRVTGLQHVPTTAPRRLGEILREPVLLGAVVGGILTLAFLRERLKLPLAAGIVALAAFCVLAAAGLPILGRYLFLPAVLLAIVCGAGAFGWLLLPPGHPWRGRARIAGIVVLLAQIPFIPAQVDRIHELRGALAIQTQIRDDLHDLAKRPVVQNGCTPTAVPNHRPVPLLALWLDRPPEQILSAQLVRIRSGQYFDPATPRVERNFTLDKRDPKRLTAEVPPGFQRVAANRSWVLYERCGRTVHPPSRSASEG
jgi:hypothetical protein